MQHEEKKALSDLRIENAKKLLRTSKILIDVDDYKSAANRSYYAIFNAMRAELILCDRDYKKHTAVISNFRLKLIKTGVLDKKLSSIIDGLFKVRTDCDYDDYYIISKEDVTEQVKNAEFFVNAIEEHLKEIDNSDKVAISKAKKALEEAQAQAVKNGTADMTMDEIDAEIQAYRQEKWEKE